MRVSRIQVGSLCARVFSSYSVSSHTAKTCRWGKWATLTCCLSAYPCDNLPTGDDLQLWSASCLCEWDGWVDRFWWSGPSQHSTLSGPCSHQPRQDADRSYFAMQFFFLYFQTLNRNGYSLLILFHCLLITISTTIVPQLLLWNNSSILICLLLLHWGSQRCWSKSSSTLAKARYTLDNNSYPG